MVNPERYGNPGKEWTVPAGQAYGRLYCFLSTLAKTGLYDASDGSKTPISYVAGAAQPELHSYCTWVSSPGSKLLVLLGHRRRRARLRVTTQE